jgi:FdhE protein
MLTAHATLDTWLAAHPYLQELVRFERFIEAELRSDNAPVLPPLSWKEHADDFSRGVPLLGGKLPDAAIVNAAAVQLHRLVDRLSGADAPNNTRAACALLRHEFRQRPDAPARIVRSVVSGDEYELTGCTQANPGLIRFLCWKALRPLLRAWIDNAPESAGDVVWGRPLCPVCGALPTMGRLSQTNKGRERFLSCGCCGTTWTFSRTTCPFCENHDQDKLEILEAEREEQFRIDVCRECSGYLKTYLDEGDEGLFLADWSSLHLDVLAKNMGLLRRANSLYAL